MVSPINMGGYRPLEESIFENLISKKQLANYLGLSISYIDKLMANEGLPRIKIGHSVRFRLLEINDWLKKRRQP